MTAISGKTAADVAEEFGSLTSCCLHKPTWQPDEVERVITWHEEDNRDWADTDHLMIVKLKDGYGSLASWSDSSGHGCRCDAATSRGATLHELLTHLTDEEIARLMDQGGAS